MLCDELAVFIVGAFKDHKRLSGVARGHLKAKLNLAVWGIRRELFFSLDSGAFAGFLIHEFALDHVLFAHDQAAVFHDVDDRSTARRKHLVGVAAVGCKGLNGYVGAFPADGKFLDLAHHVVVSHDQGLPMRAIVFRGNHKRTGNCVPLSGGGDFGLACAFVDLDVEVHVRADFGGVDLLAVLVHDGAVVGGDL